MSQAGFKKLDEVLQAAMHMAPIYKVVDYWMDPDHIRERIGDLSEAEMEAVLNVVLAIRRDIGLFESLK